MPRKPSCAPCETNGSTWHNPSTRSAASAPFMSGKGISWNSNVPTSTPSFSRDALIVTSQMFLSVFTAIVFPSRSLGEEMGPSFLTIRLAQASLSFSPPSTPWVTIFSGRFSDWAMNSETLFEKPKSKSPFTTEGTITAPPSANWVLTVRFSSSKNPWSRPRKSGATSAIGITPTVTVARSDPPDPPPPSESSSPHPATPSARTVHTASHARKPLIPHAFCPATRQVKPFGLLGRGVPAWHAPGGDEHCPPDAARPRRLWRRRRRRSRWRPHPGPGPGHRRSALRLPAVRRGPGPLQGARPERGGHAEPGRRHGRAVRGVREGRHRWVEPRIGAARAGGGHPGRDRRSRHLRAGRSQGRLLGDRGRRRQRHPLAGRPRGQEPRDQHAEERGRGDRQGVAREAGRRRLQGRVGRDRLPRHGARPRAGPGGRGVRDRAVRDPGARGRGPRDRPALRGHASRLADRLLLRQ